MDIYISSISEYIEQVLSHRDKTNEMIFRGHSSCEFELKTSVGRIKGYKKEIEKRLFLEFKKRYHLFASEHPKTDLELLFLAQHYGIPTRLLDWTYNPLIALYFATDSKNNDCNGKVYMIGLHKSYMVGELKDSTLSIDEILNISGCKYVEPYYIDPRYQNQKSIFLLSNKPNSKFTFADNEIVFIINRNSKAQIRKDLALFGIDDSFVFHTLDYLSKDIMDKLKIVIPESLQCKDK